MGGGTFSPFHLLVTEAALSVYSTAGPKDPMANAMSEMMERIKTGNIQLKPVRTVSVFCNGY